jgi:hypothetical protein
MIWDQPREKILDSPSQPIEKVGMVAHTCHLSFKESISKKVAVQASMGKKIRLHLKNNQGQKGWGWSSSDRAPV